MKDERSNEGPIDSALDREIERALAVDPSPEFLVRVRTRIASEPMRANWWGLRWALVAAGTAAMLIAVVVVSRSGGNTSPIAEDRTPIAVNPAGDIPVATGPAEAGLHESLTTAPRETAGSPGRLKPESTDEERRPAVAVGSGPSVPSGPHVVSGQDVASGLSRTKTPVASGLSRTKTPVASGLSRTEPEVIISQAEAAALRRLFVDVREGRVDLTSLPEAPSATAALEPPRQILIPAITIEPLMAVDYEEGVRQ